MPRNKLAGILRLAFVGAVVWAALLWACVGPAECGTCRGQVCSRDLDCPYPCSCATRAPGVGRCVR